MEGITRRVQSYVFLWERKLLDRLRHLRNTQLSNARTEFFVLVHFTDNRVTLHIVNRSEKIMDNGTDHLTENM